MSFAAHGNWCGPGWSAGQWKDAKDLTEEDKQIIAIDALDQACKNHDIGIAEGDPNANRRFYEEASNSGWYGLALAQFVKLGGPPLHNYLRSAEGMKISAKTKDKHAKMQKQLQMDDAAQTENVRANVKRKGSDLSSERLEKVQALEDEEETKENDDFRDAMTAVEENEAVQERVAHITEFGVDPFANFVTPDRPTMQAVPTLTRGDTAPLRGPREVGSLTNLLQDTNMDKDGDVEMSAMRAMAGAEGTGNPAKNKSVMVRYDAKQELGFLTETRTAMLPLSIYFSINKLDSASPVVFQFVVNDTYDIFRKITLAGQTFPTPGGAYSAPVYSIDGDVDVNGSLGTGTGSNPAAGTTENLSSRAITTTDSYNLVATSGPSTKSHVSRSKGVSSDMAYSIYAPAAHGMKIIKPVGLNVGRAVQFPTTVKTSNAGTTTSVSAGKIGYASSPGGVAANGDYAFAWRNWYERVYRNRHVMKADWKLTMENAQEGAYHRGVVLEAVDTVTSDPTSANYVTPTDKSLAQMLRFKRIKESRLASFNAQGGSAVNVLSGSWSPNDNRRRDVVDEELITTWYPTRAKNGPAGKFWEEYQTLLFYNDQMSNNQSGYFNCRLDLLYHVQYRDLDNYLRYPESTDATTMLQVRDMCYPATQPLDTQWPTNEDPNLLGAVNIASSWNQATK